MTQTQQPEALRLAEILERYAFKTAAAELRRQHAYIEELEAQLSAQITAAPQAVAWMDPETLDVINTDRKTAWEQNFGIGGKMKAASYTLALHSVGGVPAQAVQAEPVAWLHTNKRGDVQAFTAEPPPSLKAQCQPLYTAPQAKADAQDAERRNGHWLTVVYRDIQPGDESRTIVEHPKVSALSWSHALHDRDAALAAQAKQGGQP